MLPPTLLVRFRRPVIVALHLALVPLGYYAAFALRFDLVPPAEQTQYFWQTVWIVAGLRVACLAVFGLYHGFWRHVGMRDLLALIKAVTLSSGLFLLLLFLTQRAEGLPRAVLALDWIMAVLLLGGVRFAARGVREWRWRPPPGKRALIVGAGAAAERLIRECQRSDAADLYPVALVDDDPAKQGMRIHGVAVQGTTAELGRLADKEQVELLVIAIPSASGQEIRRIVDDCLETGIEFKIVPSMRELLDGRARMGQLRAVEIEDLLGRDEVDLGLEGPRRDIEDRVVLVTGGAGSIGSELARQVAGLNPRRLVLLDQAESALYFIHLELLRNHPGLEVTAVVGDVTDAARVEQVMREHRPHCVFHAAAYKHVPLMEAHPVEAARNNVLGTLLVAQASARAGARKFVLISTDKAVYPSSVMGATKRVAELIVLGWPELRQSSTDFRAVRFGNVLGSDGSVVPLFRRQLAAGGPLTVTHPDVTRYFMTIPEAVQLVLQAGALPEARGRICLLDMGEPVKIVDLAENLIRLSGLEPHRDVQIQFTGLRPGEKLHEELVGGREETTATDIAKVRIVRTDDPAPEVLTQGLDRLAAAVQIGSPDDVVGAVCELVPECVAPLRERGARAARVR
ncbi:MAG TPA: nucleoside-diphosphate sugar epimerase/dehydratase [Longimicrobium sp.]